MANNDAIEVEGVVTDLLGGGSYEVLIKDMDVKVTAYAAGKMKRYNIKIIPGDIVKVELSPYEPTKGRITYRSINKDVKGSKKGNAIISQDEVMPGRKPSDSDDDKNNKKS